MTFPTLATDDEIIEALKKHGDNISRAARELGISRRAVQHRLPKLARKGYSPKHAMLHHAPDGFHTKGTSTLRGADGEIKLQWTKTSIDHERQAELLREAVQAMVEDLPQLKARKAANGDYNARLMACYPIGDAHIGMLAWGEECGEDWDLAIAERIQCGAMAALVESAPAAEQATIINLGDWLHYDSLAAVTPRSGHNLDADGRYAKMVRVAIKVMRQCIESALARHKHVRVINAPGNHDETGALWLSAALAHIYEKEPRVTVDTTPSLFSYFRHGKVLVGIHHGHACKPEKLPGVMAADRAKDWGETTFRYWWTGHVHHKFTHDHPGVKVESFNTLAAKDAYATNGGYRAERNMKCIVLHDEHGEMARNTIHPAMIDA